MNTTIVEAYSEEHKHLSSTWPIGMMLTIIIQLVSPDERILGKYLSEVYN